MLKMRSLAFPLVDVVNQLASEYEVSKRAIYKDWRCRGKWMTHVLELDNILQLHKDLYATHREIFRLASKAYLSADNSNAQIGALRLMRELNLDFAEMFPLAQESAQEDDKKIILSWDVRPHWFAKLTDDERKRLQDIERPFRERALKRFES